MERPEKTSKAGPLQRLRRKERFVRNSKCMRTRVWVRRALARLWSGVLGSMESTSASPGRPASSHSNQGVSSTKNLKATDLFGLGASAGRSASRLQLRPKCTCEDGGQCKRY